MKIAEDKWKHFFVGWSMGLAFQALAFWLLPGHPGISALLALAAIVFIAYGFELFSRFTGYGHYEVMDAVAAIIGGLLGMGIGFAGYLLLQWK